MAKLGNSLNKIGNSAVIKLRGLEEPLEKEWFYFLHVLSKEGL